jgi:hypothetical protein
MINAGLADGLQQLRGHVPAAVSHLQPLGRLPAANHLDLTIGLPLRNETELDNLLREIYDPASPNFRQYLTPEQFTERFGPTKQDYQAVIDFVTANGLKVTGTHPNRVALDVNGSVADIERVLHVTLQTYRHPQEARDFYAPDVEPSVDLAVPILQISGLNNYSLPHPSFKVKPANGASGVTPNLGSGPAGSYMGKDFRAAYVPGVALTGSGQNVALVEFDGYDSNNIAAYISQAGLTSYPIVLTNVPIVGTVSVPPGVANGEVCLDIEMVIAMAPGTSKIIVYEATNNGTVSWLSMLSRIANDNRAKQISSSWGGGSPDPASEGVFKQMAAQGQSYFNASGDYDAFTGFIPFPSDSTNITEVGGTMLSTTGAGGPYASETVWNERTPNPNFGDWGSSGGISPTYPIPVWQQGINMTTNQGSTTMRNVPDVALTAANVFIVADNNQQEIAGGTSCAAPLWAGFIALVNQQTAATGKPGVGFINPAVYAIGKGTNYNADFHDVITGDNTWSGSPTKFYATPGYDLCTGWGTPAGQSLINALAGSPDVLVISPGSGFISSGASGGPFTVASQPYSLTNTGAGSLNWQIASTSAWLNVSSTSGTLPVAGQTAVNIGLNTAASNLVLGTYVANVWFTNRTSGFVQNRQFTLQVVQPLAIAPTNGFTTVGPVGGPFNVTGQNYSLTNVGAGSLSWSLINTSLWLDVSQTGGILAANGSTTSVAASLNGTANNLVAGIYTASLCFSNQTGHSAQYIPFVLQVGQSVVQNGGFEAGNFSFWTLTGDTGSHVDYNGSISGIPPHSGSYLAALGQAGSVGYISQTLPTVANQEYLLSVWFNNPTNILQISGGQITNNTPNEFSVSWNGSTLFDQVNIGPTGWTNLQFLVTASSASTVLQFGERVDPWYLGLDDVTAVPITNPSFRSVAKMSNSNAVVFAWNSMTGFVYQVQYSTNLAGTNWIILSTNTATGPTLTVTNGYGTDPRRFYRIRRLP